MEPCAKEEFTLKSYTTHILESSCLLLSIGERCFINIKSSIAMIDTVNFVVKPYGNHLNPTICFFYIETIEGHIKTNQKRLDTL